VIVTVADQSVAVLFLQIRLMFKYVPQ